jgi:hypothetical protein
MAKTKISEFSSTPANNTDIDSINIAEGCAPSGINDAIRELMAQLKDFQTGAAGDSFNGPVGATTAAAGAFTTLAASGDVTLSGGTANRVPYLNGSKVLTSGSGLTFDGTNFAVNGNNISAVNSLGFRNRIINGDMRIDQRNNGASVTASNTGDAVYTLDRWAYRVLTASKISVQQSSAAPAGFKNSLLVTSLSAYSLGASEFLTVRQPIEGFNAADLDWGTANARSVTLSFWVRSSLTGTFGGAIWNGAENRTYVYSYTINSANTWEQKTVTIAGDTSGTWLTTNGMGLMLVFCVGAGTNFQQTPGSWGNVFLSPNGQVNVAGTNGATWQVTGVQLEAGSVATPFERRDYGRELMMCQRYYQVGIATLAVAQSAESVNGRIQLTQPMRATPSLGKTTGGLSFGDMVAFGTSSSATPTVTGYELNNLNLAFNLGSFPTSSLVAYRAYRHEPSGGANAVFTMSAEL